jgi:hypothetical protein
MRSLPTAVVVETLADLARREHDLTVRGGALQRRPHLGLLLIHRFLLRRSCQTAVAPLNPYGLGARPTLRPKTDETETVLAIDGDSDQFTRIVAQTDEVRGRHNALDGDGVWSGSAKKLGPILFDPVILRRLREPAPSRNLRVPSHLCRRFC